MVARYFYKAVRYLFFRAHIRGRRNLQSKEPVIMVANHVGSFGPVSLITSMPVRMYPWVAHEVTDVKTVASRIQQEFLEQELHLKPPLSTWLGRVVGRICVALMKDIGAIPVYQKSKQIKATVLQSLSLLEQGKNILVFAEDSTKKIHPHEILEDRRDREEKDDGRGQERALVGDPQHLPQGDVAIVEARHDEGVKGDDRTRLGRGEGTEIEAAEDDDRHHHGDEGGTCGTSQEAPARPRVLGPAVDTRP